MATPLPQPILVAPARSIAMASSAVRMPPEALTPMSGPTVLRISAMSSTFAPAVEKPVDVFTKSAPAFAESSHARAFSSSVSRQVSRSPSKRLAFVTLGPLMSL